jgi:hypothetical protein
MRSRSALPFAALALLLAACSSEADSTASSAAATTAPAITTAATTAPDATTEATTADTTADTTEPSTFTAQVWADNWFSLTVNGVLVGEDSVPITTERSFNAETITFSASYPLTIALVAKDYKESDSGLEYIGTDRQQMGDGGFIAQITDTATGAIVAATGSDWRGLVIHRAPLDTGCVSSAQPDVDCGSEITAEPAGWTEAAFDDSAWPTATEYTTTEVGTKDGYDTIAWDPSAALIWTSDLKVDNTILWRTVVPG